MNLMVLSAMVFLDERDGVTAVAVAYEFELTWLTIALPTVLAAEFNCD